jgi:hypothetical protein
MTKRPPRTPVANRSPKGTGDDRRAPKDTTSHDHTTGGINLDQQGQTANTRQNTTHPGIRSDR